MDIHARYLIRTSDDVVIEVDNRGHWREVPGGAPYFVTAPVFSTDDDRYRWLTRGVFVGMAHEVDETRIVIDVYEAELAAGSAIEGELVTQTLPDLFAARRPAPVGSLPAHVRRRGRHLRRPGDRGRAVGIRAVPHRGTTRRPGGVPGDEVAGGAGASPGAAALRRRAGAAEPRLRRQRGHVAARRCRAHRRDP